MNTLYIDNRMGVSGAKLLGALVDSLDNPEIFLRRFNELGFKGVRLERRADALNGITGSLIDFIRISSSDDPYADEAEESEEEEDETKGFFSRGKQEAKTSHYEHRHKPNYRRLQDVKDVIDDLPLSGTVRKHAINIYERIAQASAAANRIEIDEIKLRRTGSRDVIASVVAICMIMEDLGVSQVIASPIATGNGYAYTYRGKMPIPIPALQNLLEKVPYSQGIEEGEICTLEGAAILREYVDTFSDMPEIVVIKSGSGFGERRYKSGVNCTRIFIGEVVKTAANASVTELEAALFDDSAEVLKLAGERLKAAGVTEAYTVPISLLAGGTGTLLKCICPNECADTAAGEILRNTSAKSVRRTAIAAYETESTLDRANTSVGEIRLLKTTGFGVTKTKPIAEDIAKVARENNISIAQAYEAILREI